MRILVTGATGFVGRWAVAACLDHGHKVAGLVLPDDPAPLPEAATVFRGTLGDPPWDDIDAFAPDTCVHAAWITTPGVYMTSPLNASFEDWSLAFFRHLLGRSLTRAVGVGSCLEYIPEAAPQARAGYVQSKRRVCAGLEQMATEHGADWAWARVFFPYGEGEPPGKLTRSMVEALQRGERFALHSPEAVRDFIAVQDAGRALARVAESPVTGTVDIGTGQPTAVREVASCVADVLGMAPDDCFEWGTEPDAWPLPLADATRLLETGWNATITLPEGVKRLVESLREDASDG